MTVQIIDLDKRYIDGVVRIHMDAFKHHLNVKLGEMYNKSFFQWFCNNDDSICKIAIDKHDGVIGYVVGAPWGYQNKFNRALFACASLCLLIRPWLMVDKRILNAIVDRAKILIGVDRKVENVQKELSGKILSLVGIGVQTEHRGKGTSNALMRCFRDEACNNGYDYIRLSVYANNAIARKFYEKTGWKMMVCKAKYVVPYYLDLSCV
jgi:ribosomal protein S18 acetylase RimI-like enzyme